VADLNREHFMDVSLGGASLCVETSVASQVQCQGLGHEGPSTIVQSNHCLVGMPGLAVAHT